MQPMQRSEALIRVIAVAGSYVGWAVEQPAGSNKGQVVETMLKGVGLAGGNPWCAAAVHHWGHTALMDPYTKQSVWPLPATGGCAILGEFAAAHDVRYEGPEVGDVFLIWHEDLKRFGHTGLVTWVSADGLTYKTLEGNTNTGQSREGIGVYALQRTVRPKDRFIRWLDLLPA